MSPPATVPRTGAGTRMAGPDRGTATVEFVFASVVLLIPLIYLLLALAQLQSASYATNSVAVHAAKTVARHPDTGPARATELAELGFADFGVESAKWTIRYSCVGDCAKAGSVVTAEVTTRMPLPGIPLLFGHHRSPHVTLVASHSDIVSPLVEDR